jgi:hypothetical protein
MSFFTDADVVRHPPILLLETLSHSSSSRLASMNAAEAQSQREVMVIEPPSKVPRVPRRPSTTRSGQ